MKVCERKGMHKAWLFYGTNREFIQNWPIMIKLSQWILVILANIAICEHEFFKHDWVKSNRTSRSTLATLDASMRVSLCSLPWRIWIGLKFLTLEIRPKTGGIYLWSYMMIKCIM